MLMKDIQDSSVRMLNSTDPMIIPHSIDAFDRIAIILLHVATNILQLFEPFLDLCVKDKKFLPDLEAKCQKYLKICGDAAKGFVLKPIVFCFDLSMQIAGGM